LRKTRGDRVSPKDIKNALQELKDMEEVVAIGFPDEILGKAIKVFIVTNGESTLLRRSAL